MVTLLQNISILFVRMVVKGGYSMAKNIYNNKNGCMDIIDFIKLIYKNNYDEWVRKHEVANQPCPPYELINDKIQCFYCTGCIEQCRNRVKEYKDYYRIGKKKYYKNEL